MLCGLGNRDCPHVRPHSPHRRPNPDRRDLFLFPPLPDPRLGRTGRRQSEVTSLEKPGDFNKLRSDEVEKAIAVALADRNLYITELTDPKTYATFQDAVAVHASAAPDLRDADLRDAFMANLNLTADRLQGAKAQGANLERANLSFVNLSPGVSGNTDLTGAVLTKADLRWAQIQGAILSYSRMTGINSNPTELVGTNLSATVNDGSALRFVDLTLADFDNRTDWRNTFLDPSVTVTDFLRHRAGDPCRWRWADRANGGEPLDDEIFYGIWRGWLEADPNPPFFWGWPDFAPEDWRDVTAIAHPNPAPGKPPPYHTGTEAAADRRVGFHPTTPLKSFVQNGQTPIYNMYKTVNPPRIPLWT